MKNNSSIPIAVFDNDIITLEKILFSIREITGKNAFGTTKYDEFQDHVIKNGIEFVACDYTLSPHYSDFFGTDVIRSIKLKKIIDKILNTFLFRWNRNKTIKYMLYSSSSIPSDINKACQSKNIIVNASYSNEKVLAEDLIHKYDHSMLAEKSSNVANNSDLTLKSEIALGMVETTKIKLLKSFDKIENKQSRIFIGRGKSSTLENIINDIKSENPNGLKLINNFFRSEVLMKEINEEE